MTADRGRRTEGRLQSAVALQAMARLKRAEGKLWPCILEIEIGIAIDGA